MSKNSPAVERVGITTPANIAPDAILGNPPCRGSIKFDRIIELAAEHEYGGAAGDDEPREHYFRSGDLAGFVAAVLAEAHSTAFDALCQAAVVMDQAGAILAAIEDRTQEGVAEGMVHAAFHHLETLSRIGTDILDRGASAVQGSMHANWSGGGAQ